ncbi:MAG TPA: IS481 family transposase [Candidatus Olsenella pullicola]|nr:IS481 family transposase [Candidatus Olsenella pullicola]
MSQHPNARLTPRGRETLVSRVAAGEGVSSVARQMGVSRQTASKWLSRARRGETMSDRSCRPHRLARLTPPDAEARVREARSSMLLAPLALAAATGVPARTCARIVARSGLPRLADVDRVTGEVRRRGPVTPVRYERERPGELVHVDVKRVARIPDGGGWRARGASELAHPDSGAGYACLHVAVDDRSRAAYAELLPDERKGTCSSFMGRCIAFFAGLGVAVEGVMTDNGPGYRSGEFNALLGSEGVRHVYTRPYSPWQNGKVERMNRTLAQEWQYGRAWESEAERAEALPAYIERYNWSRPHSACGGLPPMSRIPGVNNLLAHNT